MSIEVSNPFLAPLHTQRYSDALKCITDYSPCFIIDLGCSECDFLYYLSRNPGSLQFAVGVDMNPSVLRKGYQSISRPGICYRNTRQFHIGLVQEDISAFSESFIQQYKWCPFVTCLELIEHLEPSDLDSAVDQIFDKLCPLMIYLTTPNIEYNDLLNEAFGGQRQTRFRHPDHKFEWTRNEFASWCLWICENYNYAVEIGGVGKIVDDVTGEFGFASHSALFYRPPGLHRYFDLPLNLLYSACIDIKVDLPPMELYEEDQNEYDNEVYYPDNNYNRLNYEEDANENGYLENQAFNDGE